jgi:hypothetical protein
MTATRTPPLDELVALFRGDDLSDGFAHEELVAAICDAMKPHPSAAHVVGRRIYPTLEGEAPSEEVGAIIVRGFEIWSRRRKLKVT